MIEAGQAHVFAGIDDTDEARAEAAGDLSYALRSSSDAESAELVYHPNAMQCSGESNWICLDCGERTGEAGEA
jgi:hypothetical protein